MTDFDFEKAELKELLEKARESPADSGPLIVAVGMRVIALHEQAEKQTREMIRLTRSIRKLTWVLAALTLVQIAVQTYACRSMRSPQPSATATSLPRRALPRATTHAPTAASALALTPTPAMPARKATQRV